MKFTLSWLKEHLETEASLDDILYALTDLGLEVEGVEDPAKALKGFKLVKVTEAEKHPDADKLRVCKVETDEGMTQIVCGAPNARAGITAVLAKPGMFIPGLDITISVGKIRGVESFGMMASMKELNLGEDHDGIIELEGDAAELGMEFADYLAKTNPSKVDPIIEIAITPNRPDALGVHGIARDLAARGLGTLKSLPVENVAGSFPNPINVEITDDAADGCHVFAGRLIKGVKNGPSPQWLQDRLNAIGLRPISALVDVTNYFTYDRNRPLHVFDAAKVEGGIVISRAKGGESLVALDEKTYEIPEGALVISTGGSVESIGGIMGGLDAGCTDDTTDVFVEAAFWNTLDIAKAGRALKINSDARYRNERGIDPAYNAQAMHDATVMILEICGGEASEIITVGAAPDVSRAYKLDTDRVQSLVGMEILATRQVEILTSLGFKMDGDMAQVPSWRPDVLGEADLVEEVARVESLTHLEPKPMTRPAGVAKQIQTPMQVREIAARHQAAGLGYNECVTYSFVDQKSAELFGGGTDAVKLENPISSEMSHMRPDLLIGLLQAASRNQARGFADLALFECGTAFTGGEPGEQHLQVAGILVGSTSPKDVHGSRRNVDLYDAKADAEAILAAIGAPAKAQVLRGCAPWFHPGRSGKICLGPKKVLAEFGELHPKTVKEMGVKGSVVAFTIFLEQPPFPRGNKVARSAFLTNDLQAVDRDFAFVVDADVRALDLVNAAAGADKNLIGDVHVFDEFIGGSLEEGKKSLAITVRLQPNDKTLKEKDLEEVSAKIIAKVAKATGGVLRG